MECLLSNLGWKFWQNRDYVLILILMECLLRVSAQRVVKQSIRLNPYSNGMLT